MVSSLQLCIQVFWQHRLLCSTIYCPTAPLYTTLCFSILLYCSAALLYFIYTLLLCCYTALYCCLHWRRECEIATPHASKTAGNRQHWKAGGRQRIENRQAHNLARREAANTLKGGTPPTRVPPNNFGIYRWCASNMPACSPDPRCGEQCWKCIKRSWETLKKSENRQNKIKSR